MRMNCGSRPLLALALVLCVALGGCEKNKISKSNYDQIQIGTAFPDVEKLLGPGERTGTRVIGELRGGKPLTAQTYRWKNGGATIELEFTQGKVSKKTSTGL